MNEELYQQFKKDHPETIGETDKEFDTHNYLEWLENKYLTSTNFGAKVHDGPAQINVDANWNKELTKFDIIGFGFKYDASETSCLAFVNGVWDLWYYPDSQLLIIESEETGEIFNGIIKSRLEFAFKLQELFN